MGAESDSWQVGICRLVSRDYFSLSGVGCGGDDEVMRSSGSALASHSNEQLSVRCGDYGVIVDDGDNLGDFIDEVLASCSMGIVGELDPHEEFGDGDCSDGHLVVVGDELFERRPRAVCVDQEGGVEEKSAQGRVSISRSSLAAAMSVAKLRSRR